MEAFKYKSLTEKIIKGFYEVYNELGQGFLESVYENALAYVLKNDGLKVQQQYPVPVQFKDITVGDFRADLVIENKILVELKAVGMLLSEHEAQIINYLKATDLEIDLLMNFGNRPVFKRFIFNQ